MIIECQLCTSVLANSHKLVDKSMVNRRIYAVS